MTEQMIRKLLESIRDGGCDVEQAIAKLRTMPFEDLGFAKVDHHRALRCGFPEVIYSEGKTPEQVTAIFDSCAKAGGNVVATRATPEVFERVSASHPDARYNAAARTITLRQNSELKIQIKIYKYPEAISTRKLRAEVVKIGKITTINGIIVQLPLPKNINTEAILNSIPTKKDIDVLNKESVGRLYKNKSNILPPTVAGIIKLLHEYKKCVGGHPLCA